MPSSDTDHNYYTQSRRQRPSQFSNNSLPLENADDFNLHRLTSSPPPPSKSVPPPSSHPKSSKSPSKHRPTVTTDFENRNLGVARGRATDDASPDPYEFYRQYRDPFANAPGGLIGQGSIVISPVEKGYSQKDGVSPVQSNGLPAIHSIQLPSSHSSSASSPLTTARSNPALSATSGKSRKDSLRDLVDKFNHTPDQVPPRPQHPSSRPDSRTTSRTVSPSESSGPYSRSRNASLSKSASQGVYEAARRQSKNSATSSYRQEINEQPGVSVHPSNHSNSSRRQSTTANAKPSRVTPNLNKLHTHPTDPPRKPLFGEVVSVDTTSLFPGYGIPRQRRGSEGSMHSPNPMFSDTFSDLSAGISPSSPTAWYLGYTPSLDAVNPNRPSTRQSHRRTQSDLPNMNKPVHTSALSTHMTPMSPPLESRLGVNSGTSSKQNSQSKIPISTRRLSGASDSGHSSSSRPGSRANSAMGRYNTPTKIVTPRNGTSGLPKPVQQRPSTPTKNKQSSSTLKSPARRDVGQKKVTSPLLTASIIAPPPKKSPPLRSSRPRQPVSTATTSASRAKMVDRIASIEAQDRLNKDRSKPKQGKMLPELGKVDFAARRQKIQQAFNKTVQENHEREQRAAERRRVARERKEKEQKEMLAAQQVAAQQVREETPEEDDDEHDEKFATPVEEFPSHEQQLTIDTINVPGHRPIGISVQYDEDSPTLGDVASNVATANTECPPSASEAPMSAMTADTADTVDTTGTDSTTFEIEPQTDQPVPNQPNRTVLSQVMHLREPSPESRSHSEHGDESISELDDKESIQIMLRDAPAEEGDDDDDHSEPDETLRIERRDMLSADVRDTRMSSTSWTSSIEEGQTTELTPDVQPVKSVDASPEPNSSENHSFTTADSNRTPQSLSPPTFPSSQSAHASLDSYTSKSLPQHRESTLLNPGDRQSYIQQILNQSPDLARQGGWDPKRVTQLYLQELSRGNSRRQHVPPPLQIHRETDEAEESSQDESSQGHGSPELARERTSEDDSRQSPDSSDYGPGSSPVEQRILHRASMISPGDWEYHSPSLLDWIHSDGYGEGPTDNDAYTIGPTPPMKDHPPPNRDDSNTPRGTEDGPKLPEINIGGALGLAIHVQSPKDTDSPTIPPPPPLPTHSPPPPPVKSGSTNVGDDADISKSNSPSIYNSNPPSSVFPSSTSPAAMGMMDSPDIDEEQTGTATIYVSEPRSSIIDRSSVDRPSVDHPSLDQRQSTDVPPKAETPTPDQKRLNRRRNVIKELIDTEHSFGRDMKVVDDIYKGTSSSCLDLSPEDIKILFGNSDQIVQFSMNFLDALKRAARPIYIMPKAQRYKNNRASSATEMSGMTEDSSSANGLELTDDEKDRQTFIGSVFGQEMTRMEKVYAEYLKNHDAANKKLQNLQQNQKVSIWLKECRQWASDLTTAWDLDSLLVKPVQRILKYPLLLQQLLDVTPEDHADFTAIDVAVREMTGVSFRINEMKKRADVVEQVINSRKRKESDVRIGLQKAFGRRTEKLKQHVGLSDMFEDRQYNALEERFGSNFFQLQVVMRDVEMYTNDIQTWMNRFYDFIQAIEAYIEVGQSSHPEMESKWRKFRMTVREISTTALTEHLSTVRKSVIDPMVTLLKMHDGPQRIISKRNKRLLDFARYKATKDRGDKPDKKTTEQGEQFTALNIVLKEELPRLFSLTAQLMEACLHNFVHIQMVWLGIWQRKLSFAIDEHGIPEDIDKIIHQWTGDFSFTEAQVLTLGICNGSLLADTVNLVNFLTPSTTLNSDENSSPRRPNTFGSSHRSASIDASPTAAHPDYSRRNSSGYTKTPPTEMYQHQNLSQPHGGLLAGRTRAASSLSSQQEIYGSRTSGHPANSVPRPSTGSGRSTEPSPALPRLSTEMAAFGYTPSDGSSPRRPFSGNSSQMPGAFPAQSNNHPSPSPAQRYSGFFSSAMPMSDSPRSQTPMVERPPAGHGQNLQVLFLAASVYEFNIDRARREAGYPYLTYVAGEIFDVIGEKGELWLAKNQDDPTNQVGWIWNKHFAKLAAQ